MSSHVPSPTSSPASASGAHDSLPNSQEHPFRSSQASNPDSSSLSLESSFQLDTGYPSQYDDSQKHPKGKRKRTTTQDKAILEAAYNANPKPDKAARLDLVKRVTLNEKEVQNDRRKSRPLSPQEIAQLRFGGGLHALSSDLSSFGASMAGVDAVGLTRPDESERRSSTPGNASSQEWPKSSSGEDAHAADVPKQERRHSEPMSRTLPVPLPQTSEVPAPSQSLSQSVGYLCNRWHINDSFSAPATVERPRDGPPRLETFTGVTNSTANSPPAQALPPPSSSNSQFRISLSLEGKAEIVSSLQSPPRPVQSSLPLDTTLPPVRGPRSFQRSRSSLPGITLPPISSLTANLPPQLTRGRSRDVSAWESCCDADTRDELTKLAENESSGSAIAAISLLRSSSQTSLTNMVHGHSTTSHHSNVLRPNSSKRNAAPTSRRDATNKKPRLGRSTSSVARLQTLPPSAAFDKPEKVVVEFEPEKKRGSLSVIISPSGGDSDKENWSPDEDGNPMTRRRPLPSIAAAAVQAAAARASTNLRRGGVRGVLGESSGIGNVTKRMLLGGRSNTAPVPRLRGGKGVENSLSIFEDGENVYDENEGNAAKKPKRSDEEVERFMRGEVSPSKKGDVDCVAGLLALSQGNWR
ncbi:hypothetical protein TruAng_010586 [Truncatella angustata]|nr:hypothetical protein TruAng_010586 [Truncatella angustata]